MVNDRSQEQEAVPAEPILQTWVDAYDRLEEAKLPREERDAAVAMSLRADPDQVAEWVASHRDHLAPETIFFLEMSEAVKRAQPQSEYYAGKKE